MSASTRPVRGLDLIWLVAGFTLWGAGFSALYGLHAIGCRAGWEETMLGPLSANRIVLIITYLAHAALGAALYLPLARLAARWEGPAAGMLHRAAAILTVAAVISTLWTGAPVLLLEACV